MRSLRPTLAALIVGFGWTPHAIAITLKDGQRPAIDAANSFPFEATTGGLRTCIA